MEAAVSNPAKTVLRVKRKCTETVNQTEPVCKTLRVAKRSTRTVKNGKDVDDTAIFCYAATVGEQDDVSNVLNGFQSAASTTGAKASNENSEAPLAAAESDDEAKPSVVDCDEASGKQAEVNWHVVDVDADRVYKQQSHAAITCNNVVLQGAESVNVEKLTEEKANGANEAVKMDTSGFVYDIFVLQGSSSVTQSDWNGDELVYEAADYDELYDEFGCDYRTSHRRFGETQGESDSSESEIDYPDDKDEDADVDSDGDERKRWRESHSGSEDEYANDDEDGDDRANRTRNRHRLTKTRLSREAARLGDVRLSDSDEDPEDAACRRFKPPAADLRPLGVSASNLPKAKLDIGKFFK